MSKTVVIIGHTCSGKTTLSKCLGEIGFRRIAPYTTRPMREGEIDGVDYNFISEVDFQQAIQCNFFAENTVHDSPFGPVRYGSAKYDYNQVDNTVVILDPKAVMNLKEPIFLVWLDMDADIIRSRAKQRGFSKEEIIRRCSDESQCFQDMLCVRTPDIHITSEISVEVIAAIIGQAIKKSQELQGV